MLFHCLAILVPKVTYRIGPIMSKNHLGLGLETGAISREVYRVDAEIMRYVKVEYTVVVHGGLLISV